MSNIREVHCVLETCSNKEFNSNEGAVVTEQPNITDEPDVSLMPTMEPV